MQRSKPHFLMSLALACVSFAPLAAAEPNWFDVVDHYPQPATVTAQTEQGILLWLQTSRTAQDVNRAASENTPSLGCFAGDITRGVGVGAEPGSIDIHDFPNTAAVLDQARRDVMPLLEWLQNTYSRPRPYQVILGLAPALPLEPGFSYPSTHATLGMLFAQILAQWDPADKASLNTTGALLGTDRVLAGVHYPSDVVAGQNLGKAFATYWIDQPEHLKLIQTACAEWNRDAVVHN
jgi:hypothetical protein